MTRITLLLPIIFLGLTVIFSRAQSIDFSFTDGTNTVTGELIGQLDLASGIFTAKDAIITSAPASTGFTTPFDFASSGNLMFGGTFTISANKVTTANLEFLIPGPNTFPGQYILDLNNSTAGHANDLLILGQSGVAGPSGFSGATYTFEDAPEPSAWALMLGSLGMLAICGFRLRRLIS